MTRRRRQARPAGSTHHQVDPQPGRRAAADRSGSAAALEEPAERRPEVSPLAPVERLLGEPEVAPAAPADLDEDDAGRRPRDRGRRCRPPSGRPGRSAPRTVQPAAASRSATSASAASPALGRGAPVGRIARSSPCRTIAARRHRAIVHPERSSAVTGAHRSPRGSIDGRVAPPLADRSPELAVRGGAPVRRPIVGLGRYRRYRRGPAVGGILRRRRIRHGDNRTRHRLDGRPGSRSPRPLRVCPLTPPCPGRPVPPSSCPMHDVPAVRRQDIAGDTKRRPEGVSSNPVRAHR